MNQLTFSLENTFPYVTLAIVLPMVVVSVYWTWKHTLSLKMKRHRAGLIALRALSASMVALILFQPVISKWRQRTEARKLAVLIDKSGSMTLPTAHSLLERLSEKLSPLSTLKKPQVDYYSFAASTTSHKSLQQALVAPKEFGPTNIQGALRQLLHSSDEPYTGILLVSDGATTEESDLESILAHTNLPINTLLVGNKQLENDMGIQSVNAEEFAFARAPTPVAVNIVRHGDMPRSVTVAIEQNGRIRQKRKIRLSRSLHQEIFNIVPQQEGRQIFTARLLNVKKDRFLQNNTHHFELNVVRDKYRVLHLSGSPDWDQRFVRDTLTTWPKIDLVSFYVLRTPYQSRAHSSDGLSLIPFPTAELFEAHLNEFDIIIFQNFDPAQVGVDMYMEKAAQFVKNGGGIVFIGANQISASNSLLSTPLGNLLPMQPLPHNVHSMSSENDMPVFPSLTDAGQQHPILHPLHTSNGPSKILRALPRINDVPVMASLSDELTVLLRHPQSTMRPLLSVASVERGRLLMINSSQLWQWRFAAPLTGGPSPELYASIWKTAIKWLTRSPELHRMKIELQNPSVTSRQPNQISITVLNKDYLPVVNADVSVDIYQHENNAAPEVTVSSVTDQEGRTQIEWTPELASTHRISAQSKAGEIQNTIHVLVREGNPEYNHITADEEYLLKISDSSRGSHFASDLFINEIKHRRPQAIATSQKPFFTWNSPISLVFIAIILFLEWIFRRRLGFR